MTSFKCGPISEGWELIAAGCEFGVVVVIVAVVVIS